MEFDNCRILTESYPRREYKPSKEADLSAVVVKGLHFGQRKLLLSEIEFLSAMEEDEERDTGDRPVLAVYAGAANGSHLPVLFALFPKIRFVLIDPAPFCAEVCALAEQDDGPVIELIQDYCTDELCLRLSRMYGGKYRLYLISDIRSGVPVKMQSNLEHTKMMLCDNAWQKSWCLSLRAEAAMLKFHPPYPAVKDKSSPKYEPDDDTPDSIDYLDGKQLFGVWAPKSSSEVRLVVPGPFRDDALPKQRTYGCLEHEEQCYYYNTTNRYASDCAAERTILSRYVKLHTDTYSSADALSCFISEKLRFPLFMPLKNGFTENHARWMYLLLSTRLPEAASLFADWKDVMTISVVIDLVRQHKDSRIVPKEVKVDGRALDAGFWKAFVRGDFQEAYSLPRVRWTFFALTKTEKPRQGKRRRTEERLSEP